MEYAMEDDLEKTCISTSHNRTDGGNAATASSQRSTFTYPLYDPENCFHYMRPYNCGRVMVCGCKPDFAVRSYRHLQLLGFLCIRIQCSHAA